MLSLEKLLLNNDLKLNTANTYSITNIYKRAGSDKEGSYTFILATIVGGSQPYNCNIKFFGAINVATKVKVECKCGDFFYNTQNKKVIEPAIAPAKGSLVNANTVKPTIGVRSPVQPIEALPATEDLKNKDNKKIENIPFLCKHIVALAKSCIEAEALKVSQVSDKKAVNISNKLKIKG